MTGTLTTTNETYELRLAVDALTQPTHTKVTQTINGQDHVTRIKHDPLLQQLDDAIRGLMAATAGGTASTASTRSLVNSDALYQLTLISNTIREWCRLAGTPVRRDPVEGLRGWHAATLAQDIARPWYTSVMRRWASTIRAVVNPARELNVTTPCPACTATAWENQDGVIASHPVIVTYHPDDADILRTASARCRACDTEWRGITALRGLAFDLEQLETTNHNEQEH